MKNILFITEKFPYPLDTGGKIRTFHMLKGLSLEYNITLVTTGTIDDEKYIHEINIVCKKVYLVKAEKQKYLTSVFYAIRNFFSSVPFVVERHHSNEMEKLIRKLAYINDIVHFDHLDASIYYKCLPRNIPIVLDEHNIVSNQLRTYAIDAKGSIQGKYAQIQYGKTVRYESNICNNVTKCLVCSESDMAYLHNIAKSALISVVPNGVDIDYFTSNTVGAENVKYDIIDDVSVIFVGALDYGPGSSAVTHFCNDILPLVREVFPKLTFIAVGQNPNRSLLAMAKQDSRFVLTGRIDDVRSYMQQANVFVVPLRSGSGTRLKILSAMSMKLPVISTTIGAEGLAVTHGENILIADSPQEFSSSVVKILKDQAFAEKISSAGRNLVEEIYSWDVIWKQLLAIYRDIR